MGPFVHLTTKDAETLAFIRTIFDFGRRVNWNRWSFCDTRVRSLYPPLQTARNISSIAIAR